VRRELPASTSFPIFPSSRFRSLQIYKMIYIQLAVRNDNELERLLQKVTIADGGVLPMIHRELLPDKGRAAAAAAAAAGGVQKTTETPEK
jgi:hypothetical protein